MVVTSQTGKGPFPSLALQSCFQLPFVSSGDTELRQTVGFCSLAAARNKAMRSP